MSDNRPDTHKEVFFNSRLFSKRNYSVCAQAHQAATPCNENPCQMYGIPESPPFPPTDVGSGTFNTETPKEDDYDTQTMLKAMILGAKVRLLFNAASHMKHYLGATGDDVTVDVDEMLDDIPSFKDAVRIKLQGIRELAISSFDGTNKCVGLNEKQEDPWIGCYAKKSDSADWFYAVGGFNFCITAKIGLINCCQQVVTKIQYRIHIFDRYNWDSEKSTKIPLFGEVRDTQIGHLHKVGLAREFNIKGTSSILTEII